MEINGYKIIGVGSGGSNLAHCLAQYLNFHDRGAIVTLIDGDVFEEKNFQNQRFRGFGEKAEVKKMELRDEFANVRFRSVCEYVTRENVADMIEENDVVFLGVDHHPTRSLINAFCRNLENIVVINGGLEDTDGDVMIYVKKNGVEMTPHLTLRHPEIDESTEKASFELGCGQVMETEPARLVTVLSVVDWMMITFSNWLENRLDYCEIQIDTATARVRKIMIPNFF